MLDSTDVNMWFKMGRLALRKVSMPLARHAFEVGLRCNPDHWPCLDSLITVLYSLSDYSCESRNLCTTFTRNIPIITVRYFGVLNFRSQLLQSSP